MQPLHPSEDSAATTPPSVSDDLKDPQTETTDALIVTPSDDHTHLSASEQGSSPESASSAVNLSRRLDVRRLAGHQAWPSPFAGLRLDLYNPLDPSLAKLDPSLAKLTPLARTYVKVPSLPGTEIAFDIVEHIASGRFSQVWGAIASPGYGCKSLGNFPKHVAIKVVWKGSFYARSDAFGAVWRETWVMQGLADARAPFLNAALAVWQDDNFVYVASPRYTGALDEYLCTLPYMPSGAPPKVMPPAMFRVYAAELLLAMDGLRRQGLVSCDVKASNIFVSPTGHLTLADFDCSYYFGLQRDEDEYWNMPLADFHGTAEYMAPECVRGQILCRQDDFDWTDPSSAKLLATPRADMWSLGLVLLQIALQMPEPLFMHCFESLRTVGEDWDARVDAIAEILKSWEFEDQLHLHAELYPTVKGFLSKVMHFMICQLTVN